MILHLMILIVVYGMLLNTRENLCRGVERGDLTTAGELTIKVKADTEEYDKAMGRVIKRAKREGAFPRLPHIFWEE